MTARQSPQKRATVQGELRAAAKALQWSHKLPFERRQRARKPQAAPLVAYDLETERIRAGSPRPLYLTAYGADLHLQSAIRDLLHLRQLLRTYFLTEERRGTRFVAWNANRFDAYIVAVALVGDPDFRLRPYLTQNNTLRGLRVTLATDPDSRNLKSWEFLDGIAMTGLTGVSLDKFLETFAPDHRKLTGIIDFEREQFDPDNPRHCAYAMRDSEGLYHGITRAQSILMDTFDEPLAVTMGGACIRIFAAHLPRDVTVEPLLPAAEDTVFDYVMRGGFCFCARRYHGPIWKYDLNQAYAAAMREAQLPSGNMLQLTGVPSPKLKAYVVRVRGSNPRNRIPFYYRTVVNGRLRALFATTEIADTWITSIEHRQLLAEGWQLECLEYWAWSRTFDMREYVDKLETLRQTCEGGPKGAVGTMVKAVGNHSYGKTLERVAPIEFILAHECPDGFLPYFGDGAEPVDHVFFRIDTDRRAKAHHQPQIGSFITAHVRMVVRRAALLAPSSWLYADTDCVIFDRDMTKRLDIHPTRYGAWKVEEEGAVYRIIAKKVYQEVKPGGGDRKAKGLNVKRLTDDEMAAWYEGEPPTQEQTQVQNFLQVMQGAEMFRTQVRRGTAIEGNTAPARRRDGAKAPA